jgi:hypothetical protein
MTELFPIAPVKTKAARKGPLMDRLEDHFRDHRYESFTTLDLVVIFPEDKLDAIRNALRKLLKERLIKSTGMMRHNEHFSQPQPAMDVVCLTLPLGK